MDLLKADSNSATSEFLDFMYSYSYLPLISRPTRVTRTTATLIDNIFTNHLTEHRNVTNGVMVTKISDHYPIFHCIDNTSRDTT